MKNPTVKNISPTLLVIKACNPLLLASNLVNQKLINKNEETPIQFKLITNKFCSLRPNRRVYIKT